MLGLDQTQTRMALGIAASHTGGLTANTGTMVKSTHPGAAARQGVEAALLAQAGFLSYDSIIEASQGYVEVLFGTEFDWDALTRDLGTTFQLVAPGFNIKRYPAQIYMQWAIEAALTLQQRYHIRAEDVTYLELEVPAGNVRRSHEDVRSGLDGKFSFATVGQSHSLKGRWILTRLVMSRVFRHGSKPSYPRCGSRPTRTFRRVSPTPGPSLAWACATGGNSANSAVITAVPLPTR
jgi:2-methylcitrate dehydratase PrpD